MGTTSQISCIRLQLLHHHHHLSSLLRHYCTTTTIIPTSNATHLTNKHVFTSYSICLRSQPSWRPNAQDPHRGRRSRGPNLHLATTHCQPNALVKIRSRIITLTER